MKNTEELLELKIAVNDQFGAMEAWILKRVVGQKILGTDN